MRRRRVNKVLIFILVLVICAAGVYYLQEFRYQAKIDDIKTLHQAEVLSLQTVVTPEKSTVYLFSRDIEQGQILTENDLFMAEIDTAIVPSGVIEAKDEVVGKVLKIDVSKHLPVNVHQVYTLDDIPDDLREKEFSSFDVPTKLITGDTVDIRIKFPSGNDYIVLSKKVVYDLERLYSETNQLQKETVWLHLDEEEITFISSAIVDAYLNGAQIYAVEYIDPYVQEAAVVNYPLNYSVLDAIMNNPDLLTEAEMALQLENRITLEAYLIELRADGQNIFKTPEIPISDTNESLDADQDVTEDSTTENSQSNEDSGDTFE